MEHRKSLSSVQPQREINLLVLGETGVGKSTWINSFANYLAFYSLEDAENGKLEVIIPTSFQITDDDYKQVTISTGSDGNEVLRAGESATQKPRTYRLNYNDYMVRIIDTPGIGDSRGPQQDKINFQMIMDHLAKYKEIHGICILLKPNNARLTVLFEFCIKHLLTHLHRDSIKNIVFCFTNARNTFYRPGSTLAALKELLKKFQDLEIPLDKSTMYCLDNESLQYLAAVKEGLNFEDQKEVYAKSWELSSKETHRLLERIINLEPHQLQNTVTLNDTRRIVLDLTKPLADLGNNIQKNIERVKEKEQEIHRLNVERKAFEEMDFYIPVVTFNYVQLPKVFRVCNNSKCCEMITLENGETDKQRNCKKPKSSGIRIPFFKSKNCPRCLHPKSQHIDIDYEIRESLKKEKCKELEINFQRLDQSIESIKTAFLNSTQKRIKDLENEQQKIIEVCSKFASFLKMNAIAPYNDTMVLYLDQKIETVKLEKSPSTAKLVQDLEIMKKEYLKEVQVLEERIKSSKNSNVQCYEIPLLKAELTELPLTGRNIKDVLEKQASVHGSTIDEKVVNIQGSKIYKKPNPSSNDIKQDRRNLSSGNPFKLKSNIFGLFNQSTPKSQITLPPVPPREPRNESNAAEFVAFDVNQQQLQRKLKSRAPQPPQYRGQNFKPDSVSRDNDKQNFKNVKPSQILRQDATNKDEVQDGPVRYFAGVPESSAQG